MRPLLAVAAAFTLLVGCGRTTEVNVNVDTAGTAPATPEATLPEAPQPAPGDSSAPPAPSGSDVSSWTVTPVGLGPVQVGMAEAEAKRLLGTPAGGPAPMPGSTCTYINGGRTRPGIAYMLNEGRVARVDVDPNVGAEPGQTVPASQLPKTAEGVGVGSTEAEVRRVYGARLRTTPHHYVQGGSYLWLPVADTATQAFVLETNETGVVTSLRAGRRPEAEWIEGCS